MRYFLMLFLLFLACCDTGYEPMPASSPICIPHTWESYNMTVGCDVPTFITEYAISQECNSISGSWPLGNTFFSFEFYPSQYKNDNDDLLLKVCSRNMDPSPAKQTECCRFLRPQLYYIEDATVSYTDPI